MATSALDLLTNDPVEFGIITLKTRMMIFLCRIIRETGMTQKEAAEKLAVSQPRISDLHRGKISKFSIDMLIQMLGRMGYMLDVSFDIDNRDAPIFASVKKSVA